VLVSSGSDGELEAVELDADGELEPDADGELESDADGETDGVGAGPIIPQPARANPIVWIKTTAVFFMLFLHTFLVCQKFDIKPDYFHGIFIARKLTIQSE
jgi:hypothetical protein